MAEKKKNTSYYLLQGIQASVLLQQWKKKVFSAVYKGLV